MLTANMSELNNCLFTPSTNTVSVSNTVHTLLNSVFRFTSIKNGQTLQIHPGSLSLSMCFLQRPRGTFLTQVYITGIINPDCVNSKDGFRYLKDILH